MTEEGYIKFNFTWMRDTPIPVGQIAELNTCRNKLFGMGLIGVGDDGIGFGNISRRYKNNTFMISGSATGQLPQLDEKHYSLVTDYDIQRNHLACSGAVKASSESLTHAAIYGVSPQTNAVIHVHHIKLWEKLLNKMPTTNPNAKYGTPEMAFEIQRLFSESKICQEELIIMSGHKEGIISFGKTLNEALYVVEKQYSMLR